MILGMADVQSLLVADQICKTWRCSCAIVWRSRSAADLSSLSPSAAVQHVSVVDKLVQQKFTKFPWLVSLSLSRLPITDPTLSLVLTHCHSLARLDVTGCPISYAPFELALDILPRLTTLRLRCIGQHSQLLDECYSSTETSMASALEIKKKRHLPYARSVDVQPDFSLAVLPRIIRRLTCVKVCKLLYIFILPGS